jgi:ferrochelatase
MTSRLGVLLMTYGSPRPDLRDLADYLAAVRGGRPVPDELVAEFRRRYEVIGGSPLIPITRRQAAAVEERLRSEGVDAVAGVGMRFSEPSISRGIRDLVETGCGAVSAIIMSPQYSELLMAGYRRTIDAAVDELGLGASNIRLAPAWYREPAFLDAVAERIRQGLRRLPEGAPVLLTAHSLPKRIADEEPAYLDQLVDTARLVATKAGLSADRWMFCWQSAGHEPGEWMQPDLADVVPRIASQGHSAVLVAPIQFLADHLEVLYDVDVGARAQADEAGLAFARIESLNLSPTFIGALASIASSTQVAQLAEK